MIEKSKPPSLGILYVVATPIGNLSDITMRAIDTLKTVELIACEDTRVSRKLCQHYHITAPLIAYHDHNADRSVPMIVERLQQGAQIALISDAGTPLISDPGYSLLSAVIAAGIRVIPIPGASSMISALSAAGLPTDAVFFGGFLPSKQQARMTRFTELCAIPATLVLFESSHRLAVSLQDAAAVMGDRHAVIAREMTKLYEEFRRDTLVNLATHYLKHPEVKGEVVMVIAPPVALPLQHTQAIPLLKALLPHYSLKDASAMVATAMQLPRHTIYDVALSLKHAS
jgi:16S rRNA (cytidine1402-2'-O)-methyltransferase